MREAVLEIVLFAAAACFALVGFKGTPAPTGTYIPGARDSAGLRVVTWNVGGTRDHGQPLRDEHVAHVAAAS